MNEMSTELGEIAYMVVAEPETRHRLAKEIAESILAESSSTEQAYLYCLHKLTNGTQQPKLWRDVLACIDELTGEKK
jgi:hypothetical protein